jgi:hypothetical protein
LARRIQQNRPPAPPKYPPSAPNINVSSQSHGVIFVEGIAYGAAIQGQPIVGYLLKAENGFYLLAENGDNLTANK